MEDFRMIQFGKADAQTEVEFFPNLLKNGYFDKDNVVNSVLHSPIFLFLGYKGAGKTALSEHLKLIDDADCNVSLMTLTDLPYKSFAKIISGDDEVEQKVKVAWRWLLLVKVLYCLYKDNESVFTANADIRAIIDLFTKLGVFPVTEFSNLITKTASNRFKAEIQGFEYEYTSTRENSTISLMMLMDYLKEVILSCKEERQQIIVIDGLDSILTSREIQYISIAGLINEAKELNALFARNGILVKILVLCRTDIFERLPDPNKNKIRRDCSYSFNWYIEGADDQHKCGLIDIANIRSRLIYPQIDDMFEHFFPSRHYEKETTSVLLDVTRHTPRDFLQLLSFIQKQCVSTHVTSKDITKGINEYSATYFLPEIKDEMVGYIPYQHIDSVVTLLSSLHEKEFYFKDIEPIFVSMDLGSKLGMNLGELMAILYECSAIGNVYSYTDGQEIRVSFKYRNRNSSFNAINKITLHRGLWKALNVNY